MVSSRSIEFHYSALESVRLGQDLDTALPALVASLQAARVFVVSSGSLSKRTGQFQSLQAALGSRWAGLFDCIGAHTPREQVLLGLAQARAAGADLLVSIGGGSVIDACKVMQLAIDQHVETAEALLDYAQLADGVRGSKAGKPELFGPRPAIRQIAVPTTLSGAEYSNNAGVLDTAAAAKEGYRAPRLCPQHIIYDPALTRYTPEWLWLSTAIRSLDHAVEGYCSADCHAYLEAHFLHAMRLFAESLPVTAANPDDAAARNLNQQAVWLACCGLGTVRHGASHGIGYILGSLCDIPHGYTSCVMLPAVLAYNESVLADRANHIAAALGRAGSSASEAVRSLVLDLGLPTTLTEVGVKRSQLAAIAERAIQHPVVRNNPRPLTDARQVESILELAL